MFYLYILRTADNKLYVGQTNNLEERLKQHASHSSKSAHYLKITSSIQLVYSEAFLTRQEAIMKREWQLKNWSRIKKEALIKGDKELLKKS